MGVVDLWVLQNKVRAKPEDQVSDDVTEVTSSHYFLSLMKPSPSGAGASTPLVSDQVVREGQVDFRSREEHPHPVLRRPLRKVSSTDIQKAADGPAKRGRCSPPWSGSRRTLYVVLSLAAP